MLNAYSSIAFHRFKLLRYLILKSKNSHVPYSCVRARRQVSTHTHTHTRSAYFIFTRENILPYWRPTCDQIKQNAISCPLALTYIFGYVLCAFTWQSLLSVIHVRAYRRVVVGNIIFRRLLRFRLCTSLHVYYIYEMIRLCSRPPLHW